MNKFRKKPVIVEAEQWFKVSDFDPNQKRDVDYYRTPSMDGQHKCRHCADIMHNHGWIDTLEGGHTVCPGDWIITGVNGEKYPCKPDIFEKTYEAVELEKESPKR